MNSFAVVARGSLALLTCVIFILQLLEGFQSSMVIPKMASVSHDKGRRNLPARGTIFLLRTQLYFALSYNVRCN